MSELINEIAVEEAESQESFSLSINHVEVGDATAQEAFLSCNTCGGCFT